MLRAAFRPAGAGGTPTVKDRSPKEVALDNILFATDFGPGAERAAAYALSLAQEQEAHLTSLHVIENDTEHSVPRQREISVARMRRLLAHDSEYCGQPEFRVAFGSAVEEILTAAKESNANLKVMGAKAQKNLTSHAPLTIAYNVVAKAPCPVLTVRG